MNFSKVINYGTKQIGHSGIEKSSEMITFAKKSINGIKDTTLKKTFNALLEKLIFCKKQNSPLNFEHLSMLAQKVDMVENPEIKKEIVQTLKELISKNKNNFNKTYDSKIEYVEDLTDAVNILNDKYQNIHSEPRDLYKKLKDTNSYLLDLIDGKKGTPDSYRNGSFFNQKTKIPYEIYDNLYERCKSLNLPETYQNNLKYEGLRKFYDKYGLEKTKIANVLYKTEYLKTVNPEIKPMLKDIYNEYGTAVISSNANTTKEDAEYVKEELRLWLNAGKNEAILPEVIDVNNLDLNLLSANAEGVAYQSGKIFLADLLAQDTYKGGFTLRHEITHLNDFYEENHKHDLIGVFKQLKWHVLKKMHKKQWLEELKVAGVQSRREYALTERAELKAVASEARDYQCYSNSFVTDLVERFKMPYWILNLSQNFVREKKLLEDFYKSNNTKI